MALTTAQAAGYLNETLEALGNDYRIDTTSDATLTEGFQTVGAFPPALKSNILDMQMLILVQRTYDSMFSESKNPTRRFWRNAIDYGSGIRETFLKLIEAEDGYWAEDFDGADDDTVALNVAKDLVKFKKDDLINKIHPVNHKFRVKMSMSDLEYAKVFTPQGYADFVGRKYANLQASAEAKLMDIAIATMKQMVDDSKIVFHTGFDVNTPNGVTSFVEALNTVSDGMETLADAYNYDGVRTTSNADDVYLVTTPELFNRIKSRGYANAFNLQEYINKNKIIMLPAGTDLGKHAGRSVGAMLIDVRAILMAVKYWEVMPFIVSNSDYRNTFLKVQLASDYNEFFNAVAFVTGDVDFFTDAQQGYATIMVSGEVYDPSTTTPVTINGKRMYEYAIMEYDKWDDLEFASTVSYAIQVPVGSYVETMYDGSYTTASMLKAIGFASGQTCVTFPIKVDNTPVHYEDRPNPIGFYVTADMVSFEFSNTSASGGLGGLGGVQGEV